MQRFGLALIALLVAAPPVAADWLVTHDGSRIQTRGAWQVKGATVTFTNHRGTFSSLPVSEIDLASSRTASQPTRRPAAVPTSPAAADQPMAVITNKDIRRARVAQPQVATTSGNRNDADTLSDEAFDAFDGAPDLAEAAQGVTWHRVQDGDFDGVEVVGTLENDGEGMVTDLGVTVSLRDDHDQVIATQRAVVQARSLMPGSFTRFQARFADLDIEEDEQTRVEVHCQAKRLVEKEKVQKEKP